MSRCRLLELGVEEVCFGDTIGVGVPPQVRAIVGARDGRRDPARADRVPLPRHARHCPRQCRRRRCRWACAASMPRPAGPVAVHTRRAPPGNLATEDLVYLLDAIGLDHGVDLDGVLRAARFIADALGKPLATKVGQAGGWDPATGAADRARLIGPGTGHAAAVLVSSPTMNGVVLVLNQNYEPLERLQPAAGVPARVRREGRDHRVRPPGHPDAPDGVPRAVGDPAPVPGPAAAAAGQAEPPRDLRARPAHLPVLRPAEPRPDARPHRSAPPRRRPHVGEPRHGLQGVQPPEGRQDARGGALPAASGRHSSRAATSTRCSRRTSPTNATRPGGPTCSWAGTERRRPDARRDRGGLGRGWGDPRRGPIVLRALWTAGHAAYVVGGGPRDALLGRPTVRRLGPRDVRAARARRPPCSKTPCTRTGSGPWSSVGAAASTRSRRSAATTTTPTSGGRTGWSSGIRSRRTSRDATSRSTRWPGVPTPPPRRHGSSTSHGGLADLASGRDPRGRRPAGAVRGGRAADHPSHPAGRDPRVHDRACDPRGDP